MTLWPPGVEKSRVSRSCILVILMALACQPLADASGDSEDAKDDSQTRECVKSSHRRSEPGGGNSPKQAKHRAHNYQENTGGNNAGLAILQLLIFMVIHTL